MVADFLVDKCMTTFALYQKSKSFHPHPIGQMYQGWQFYNEHDTGFPQMRFLMSKNFTSENPLTKAKLLSCKYLMGALHVKSMM